MFFFSGTKDWIAILPYQSPVWDPVSGVSLTSEIMKYNGAVHVLLFYANITHSKHNNNVQMCVSKLYETATRSPQKFADCQLLRVSGNQ